MGIAAGFDRYGRLARRVAALGFGFNEIGSLTANEVAQLGVMHNGAARLGISLTPGRKAGFGGEPRHIAGRVAPCRLPDAQPDRADQRTAAIAIDTTPPSARRPLRRTTPTEPDGRRRVPLLAAALHARTHALLYRRPACRTGFDGLLAAHDPGPPATAERYRARQDPRRQAQACQQIEELRRFCGPDMALLSVGGVQTADHLRARMTAGAELVQVHTAFMHQSPWLARRLLR